MRYTVHVPLNGWGTIEIHAKDTDDLKEKLMSIQVSDCIKMDLDIFPGGYAEDNKGNDVDIDVSYEES